MKIESIGSVVAQRALLAGDEPLVVSIGTPALYEGGPDYYCPYCIDCAGEKRLSYAAGADSVQALQLAMKKIGADLESFGRRKRVQVSWFADTPGETGFPP